MNSTRYDDLMHRLMIELDHEYPNLVRLRSIIEASNCPYLRQNTFARANASGKRIPVKK